MDNRKKIEEAIHNFKENRKKSELLNEKSVKDKKESLQVIRSPELLNANRECLFLRNMPASLTSGGIKIMETPVVGKDILMDEFDQFLFHDKMKKQVVAQEFSLSVNENDYGSIRIGDPLNHPVTEEDDGMEIIEEAAHGQKCHDGVSATSTCTILANAETSIAQEPVPEQEGACSMIPSCTGPMVSYDRPSSAQEPVHEEGRDGSVLATLTSPMDPNGETSSAQDMIEDRCGVFEECSEEETEGVDEESNDDEEEYLFPTPDEISNAKAPQVGMVFSSVDDAVRYVNIYGKLEGFSVVKGRNYKNRKTTIMCNKSRITKDRTNGQRKRKRTTIRRTKCPMNVTVKLVETKWHIISCVLGHNHDLCSSPALTNFFLSHRTMSNEEKMLSKLLQEIRVKPQRIMTLFRKMKGSFGNVTFGKKKLENLKQAERKMKRNSDIDCTLKYIEKIQLEKPGFCCKMEVDSEGAVRSIFWTDARSRLDYRLFGEIICFDTTYSTNRYNMPFAPIIGINGNARTIVFGWALLKDQRADTFEWLFESFIEIMEGRKPDLILTDQDVAIKNAVSTMFPDAWHRFCIWHILKCLRENMSAYMAEREGMEDMIIRLIMQSLTELEFETGWNEMLVTYDSRGHDHLQRMWAARKMFVPAYFQGRFCPFTRTTGRSESFNSNFKDYIMRKDSIENFLKQYELFQENVIQIENEDRFQSTQKIPVMWARQPIEKHAGQVYTRVIFQKFVTELVNATAFGVTEVVKDNLYEIRKLWYYEHPEYRREMFTVVVDRNSMSFECECGKFDKDGILCCHILRLFIQFDVVRIPEQYILERWTTAFREKELLKHKQETLKVQGSNAAQNSLRHAMIMNCLSDVCADISRDGDKSNEFVEEVLKLHKKLMGEDSQQKQATVLKDPPVIKKKSTNATKEVEAPETNEAAPGGSLSMWINDDGSISKPAEVKDSRVKLKTPRKKKKQGDGQAVEAVPPGSSLKDPPVSSGVSVPKGSRLKPASEKNASRSKCRKKQK